MLGGATDGYCAIGRFGIASSPATIAKIGTRRLWKPYGAAIIDVAFTADPNRFRAMASNGFVYDLEVSETP